MNCARQQITNKECTRAKKGRQVDISKTSPGRVDKAGSVVVCSDTMWFASCEALAMANKILSSRLMDSVGCARQSGGQFGMEGCGVGMLWVGVQIAFQGDVWREGCHGGVRSSAMDVVLVKAGNLEVRSMPTSWIRPTLQSALRPSFPDVRAAPRAFVSPPPTCRCS